MEKQEYDKEQEDLLEKQLANRDYKEMCHKCGNPIEMYWCMECESHGEDTVCFLCGKDVAKYDPDYHTSCN